MDERIITQITSIVVKEVIKELRKHPVQWQDDKNYEDEEDDDYGN